MKYFARFNESGERITTYVEGVHDDIPSDAIEITEEEQVLYATNNYIRSDDGKPIEKPITTPEPLEYEQIDTTTLDMAETTIALNERITKLEGGK